MAEAALPSSHSSFCEEVFSRTAHAGTNEVDRRNILAPGFWSGTCRTHLPPAFTPESSGIGPIGKLYPVTAAQLLPIRTGFLAPIHFSKLAKNWSEKYPLARGAARFISQLSGLRRHKPPAKCDNRAIGRQRFFLHGESLKDRVALLCRSDRVGYVPKIIGRVLSNEAA
jgi:hypothetical protein